MAFKFTGSNGFKMVVLLIMSTFLTLPSVEANPSAIDDNIILNLTGDSIHGNNKIAVNENSDGHLGNSQIEINQNIKTIHGDNTINVNEEPNEIIGHKGIEEDENLIEKFGTYTENGTTQVIAITTEQATTKMPECPAGFTKIGGRCYVFSSMLKVTPRNWDAAKEYCTAIQGGDLATAGHGMASNDDPLLKYIYDNDLAETHWLWLGAKKTGSQQYHWLDGRELNVDSYLWWFDQPNGQDCVMLYAKWSNNDNKRNYITAHGCTGSANFVCEKNHK